MGGGSRGIATLVVVCGLAGAAQAARPARGCQAAIGGEQRRRYAVRTKVGLELASGVDIPLKTYLATGGDTDQYSTENGPGFGFDLALTLNSVELRWAYSRLATGRVRGRIPDDVATFIRDYFGKVPEQEIDVQAPGPIIIHALTLGYRFTFQPRPGLRLALPLGGGMVRSEPPRFGLVHYALFGFGAHFGLLADYSFARVISVGAGARLSFYITEPDPNLAAAGIAARQNLFDSSVAWLPMLSFAAHLRVQY